MNFKMYHYLTSRKLTACLQGTRRIHLRLMLDRKSCARAGADSVLASLSRRDFDTGMKALRAHAADGNSEAIFEPIDVFSLLGARECRRHSKRWLVEALP
jgi:hypothetical protein